MSEMAYEYDNFKAITPKVVDGVYIVKNGITYKLELPADKMRFTKRVNVLTGEVYYPSNGDRIRSMSDDELAFYIVNHPMWSDESACVAWLKTPVEVDNG